MMDLRTATRRPRSIHPQHRWRCRRCCLGWVVAEVRVTATATRAQRVVAPVVTSARQSAVKNRAQQWVRGIHGQLHATGTR
eukprot:gene4075-3395_t